MHAKTAISHTENNNARYNNKPLRTAEPATTTNRVASDSTKISQATTTHTHTHTHHTTPQQQQQQQKNIAKHSQLQRLWPPKPVHQNTAKQSCCSQLRQRMENN